MRSRIRWVSRDALVISPVTSTIRGCLPMASRRRRSASRLATSAWSLRSWLSQPSSWPASASATPTFQAARSRSVSISAMRLGLLSSSCSSMSTSACRARWRAISNQRVARATSGASGDGTGPARSRPSCSRTLRASASCCSARPGRARCSTRPPSNSVIWVRSAASSARVWVNCSCKPSSVASAGSRPSGTGAVLAAASSSRVRVASSGAARMAAR